MSCNCGYQTYDINGSGGVVCGGVATIAQSPNRYSETSSGGVVCGGVSTLLTNQPFDGYSGIFHLIEDGSVDDYHDSSFRADGVAGTSPYCPTKTSSNLYSFCQSFDGNDYIQIPIDQTNANYSVSFWFKITGRFRDRILFSRGMTDKTNGYGCSIAIGHTNIGSFDEPESNRLFARVTVEGLTNWKTYRLQSSVDIPNDCWHHAALVYTSGVNAKLYLDGELTDTETITETNLIPADNYIQIGRKDNQEFAEGEIQEVRFTNQALTADWIETEFLNLCSAATYDEGEEESATYS